MPEDLADTVLAEIEKSGPSAASWALAWARTLPTALVVPAFGLGLLPLSLRVAFALVLSLAFANAVPAPVVPVGTHWAVALTGELARGLPIALSAAITVWAGVLAGGLIDAALPASTGHPGGERLSFARWFGLPAAALFLELGGASRAASRLSAPPLDGALARAAYDLAAGIEVGVAIGIPILIVALLVDVSVVLLGRELRPLRDPAVASTLRALAVLVVMAALLERMLEALSRAVGPAS